MRIRRTAMALVLGLSALLAAQPALRRDIDGADSKAAFSVDHIYVERVNGTVPIASGTLVLPMGSVIPAEVAATLDASRIKTGDDDRDASLQGPDWFDVKRFPTWTFESTRITPSSATAFTMQGTLTIRGAGQNERLDVTVTGTPERPRYHATGTIDRHAFGMPVTRLDPVIGNPVRITLDIVLN